MNKKKVLYGLFAFGIMCIFIGVNTTTCKAELIKVGECSYVYCLLDKQSVWVTQIILPDNKKDGKLKIPSSVDGKSVVKLGALNDTWLEDSDDIFNLFGIRKNIEEGTGELGPISNVKKLSKITKIILPSTVKTITTRCFASIPAGKSIYIPKKVKKCRETS